MGPYYVIKQNVFFFIYWPVAQRDHADDSVILCTKNIG